MSKRGIGPLHHLRTDYEYVNSTLRVGWIYTDPSNRRQRCKVI